MKKKSQIYFFAAIILIGMVFLIVESRPNFSYEKITHIENYFNNYKNEAAVVLNNAIYSNKNLTSELRTYTESFIEYGESKNLDFRILFMYSHDGKVHIVNYLKEPALINNEGIGLENTQEKVINDSEVSIYYGNQVYTFGFNLEKIEFKALFGEGG